MKKRPFDPSASTRAALPPVLKLSEIGRHYYDLGPTQLWVNSRTALYRSWEVSVPTGLRRYSKALVERHVAGESTANFGAGRLKDRKAS